MLRYLIALGVLSAISLAIWGFRRSIQKSTLSRLGEGTLVVPIYSRSALAGQRVLIALAVAFPAVGLLLLLLTDRPMDGVWEIARSSAFTMWAIGWQQSAVLYIGPAGISLGGKVFLWTDALDVQFDRDIGQLQWGLSLRFRQGRRSVRRRIYIVRENQPEAAAAIERFCPHPADPPAEAVAERQAA